MASGGPGGSASVMEKLPDMSKEVEVDVMDNEQGRDTRRDKIGDSTNTAEEGIDKGGKSNQDSTTRETPMDLDQTTRHQITQKENDENDSGETNQDVGSKCNGDGGDEKQNSGDSQHDAETKMYKELKEEQRQEGSEDNITSKQSRFVGSNKKQNDNEDKVLGQSGSVNDLNSDGKEQDENQPETIDADQEGTNNTGDIPDKNGVQYKGNGAHEYYTRSKSQEGKKDAFLNDPINDPEDRRVQETSSGILSATFSQTIKTDDGKRKQSFVKSRVEGFSGTGNVKSDKRQEHEDILRTPRNTNGSNFTDNPNVSVRPGVHSYGRTGDGDHTNTGKAVVPKVEVQLENFDSGKDMQALALDDHTGENDSDIRATGSQCFENETEEMILSLNTLQTEIMNCFKIAHRVKTGFPGLEISVEENGLKFKGPKHQVENAISQIESKTEQIIQEGRPVNLSKNHFCFLQLSAPWSFVKSKLNSCVWEYYILFKDAELVVYSYNQRDVDSICQIIREAVVVEELTFIHTIQWKSEAFVSFTNEISEKHQNKVSFFTEACGKKLVVATKDIIQTIMSEIRQKNQSLEKTISEIVQVPKHQYTFYKRWHAVDFPEVVKNFQVKIEGVFTADKKGWKVEGPEENVRLAMAEIRTNFDNLVIQKLVVKDPSCQCFFLKESEGKGFVSSTEKKYSCCIGTNQCGGSDDIGGSTYDNTKTWTYSNGATVGVMCGSAKDCLTDVIVIPTPREGFQGESIEFVLPKNLKDKNVEFQIPVWKGGVQKEKSILDLPVKRLFDALISKEITSMSISFEVEKSTGWNDIKFLKQILEKFDDKSSLRCILFHTNRARCADAEREIEIYLSKDIEEGNIGPSSSSFYTDHGNKDHSRICIKVSKGILVDKQTEVIVNTTSKELALQYGAVSKSILDKAGQEIQNECKQRYPNGVKYGEVAVTKGYLLKANNVYHGAIPGYDKTYKNTDLLESFVIKCLLQANDNGLSEICFPSIGTGKLEYPKQIAAQAMFRAVERFESSGRNHTVTNVNFVIFPKDTEAVQAFQVEEQQHHQRTAQTDHTDEFHMQLTDGKSMIVSFGKPFDYDADGMVVFWTKTKLYSTPVSYLKNAGHTYVNAWNMKGRSLPSNKYLSMDAGDLPFASIFHQFVDEKSTKLGIQQMFVKAESEGLKDVVIPLVLSDPMKTQKLLLTSVYEAFKLDKVKSLKTVRIIVDDIKLLDEAKEQFSKLHAVTERRGTKAHPDLILTVTSNDKSNTEGAIKDLEKKIEDIKKKKPPRPPPPATVNKLRKEVDTQNKTVDDMKGHQSTHARETVSVHLHQSDEEKCRVVFTVLDNNLLAKDPRELKLGLIKELKAAKIFLRIIVFPHHADHQGLIIFHEQKDANDFLKKKLLNGRFEFNPFPAQVLTNIHAELADDFTQLLIRNNFNDLQKEIEESSGAKLSKNNSTYYLEGSVNDISLAEAYINGKLADLDQPLYDSMQSNNDEFHNSFTNNYNSLENSQSDIPIQPIAISKNKDERKWDMGDDTLSLSGSSISAAKDPYTKQMHGSSSQMSDVQKPFKSQIKQPNEDNANCKRIQKVSSPVDLIHKGPEIFKTNEGISVYVYTGDILKLQVECIVNTTNYKLDHAGGLALKIANAAGKDLEEDCQKFIETNGNLSVGGICVTRAGNLKQYKHVIHIVGPDWRKYQEIDYDKKKEHVLNDLSKTLIGSLFEAHRKKCYSVALPAVCSGSYGVPMDICIAAYRYSVQKFSEIDGKTSTLKEIHFVDLSDKTVEKIANGFLNPQTSHATENLIQHQYPQQEDTVQAGHRYQGHNDSNTNSVYPYKDSITLRGRQAEQIHVNEKLKVVVYTGDIFKEKNARAIVSAEDECFLGKGKIASLLLEKGGPEYLNERKSLKKNKSKYTITDVVDTEAGNLPFKYVLHAIMPIWNKEKGDTSELEKAHLHTYAIGVENILDRAFRLPISAVTFPLIGAGRGLDSTRLGSILVHSIMKISKQWISNADCQLQHIYIVNSLDSSTKAVLSCFEKCISETHQVPPIETQARSQEKQMISLYGKQPAGFINSSIVQRIKLPQFQKFNTIDIEFIFPADKHTDKWKPYNSLHIHTYLPDSPEGKTVLGLLDVAFQQKKLFEVSYSTDACDCIALKKGFSLITVLHGMKENFGNLPKTYLSDLKKELQNVGITEHLLRPKTPRRPNHKTAEGTLV